MPMGGWVRSLRGAGMAVALLLAGCGSLDLSSADSDARFNYQGRDMRERAMQQRWIGRTRDELEQTFGRPMRVMHIPGNRLPPSFILVFPGNDPGGRCIDAFVVLMDSTELVMDYFCR
jgi:hypothetical protein